MNDWRYPEAGGTQDVFFDRASARTLPTIVAGDGVYLIDDRGRRLLDVCSGPFLAALGQGNERVLQAMVQQGQKLSYRYSRTTRHPANAALTERVSALAGAGFERVHLTSGGSEAVEMALKFLRAHAVAAGARAAPSGDLTDARLPRRDAPDPRPQRRLRSAVIVGLYDCVLGEDPGAAHVQGFEPGVVRHREPGSARGDNRADGTRARPGVRHGTDRRPGLRRERAPPVVRQRCPLHLRSIRHPARVRRERLRLPDGPVSGGPACPRCATRRRGAREGSGGRLRATRRRAHAGSILSKRLRPPPDSSSPTPTTPTRSPVLPARPCSTRSSSVI